MRIQLVLALCLIPAFSQAGDLVIKNDQYETKGYIRKDPQGGWRILDKNYRTKGYIRRDIQQNDRWKLLNEDFETEGYLDDQRERIQPEFEESDNWAW